MAATRGARAREQAEDLVGFLLWRGGESFQNYRPLFDLVFGSLVVDEMLSDLGPNVQEGHQRSE